MTRHDEHDEHPSAAGAAAPVETSSPPEKRTDKGGISSEPPTPTPTAAAAHDAADDQERPKYHTNEDIELLRDARRLAGRATGAALVAVLVLAAVDHTIPAYLFTSTADGHLGTNPGDTRLFCYLQMRVAYDAGWHLLGLRYAVVTVGAIAMLLGTLLTIAGIRASFRLEGSREGTWAGALRTSSPGLVLVTMSAIVLVAALARTQDFSMHVPDACFDPSPRDASSGPGDARVSSGSTSDWAAIAARRAAGGAEGSGVEGPDADAGTEQP